MNFDAVVVGSGPNGLAAAIAMQQAGLSVKIFEAKDSPGGGMRSAELTRPGFIHDICSAIHPMGMDSPFFRELPLDKHGLEWITPEYAVAHPFEDGEVAYITQSIEKTAASLGVDAEAYKKLMTPLVRDWEKFSLSFLGPMKLPKAPIPFINFGLKALQPADLFARRTFKGRLARGLFAGIAAHSLLPLSKLTTSAIGLVLNIIAHRKGWPLPKGGTIQLSNALVSYFKSLGGEIECNQEIRKLSELPPARIIMFDLTPRQILDIAGEKFSFLYKKQLKNFKYGLGVYKIDYALSGEIPWKNKECAKAGTVHLGGTLEEIAFSEKMAFSGKVSERPYVLVAQQSMFDETRAPKGFHTGWAYCHVPASAKSKTTEYIENQLERFAPGFKDVVLQKHIMGPEDYHQYNQNYIGGDINGGMQDLSQVFTRPVISLKPHRTSAKGIYICSASTPPGGGVHGLSGYRAARLALKEVFNISIDL